MKEIEDVVKNIFEYMVLMLEVGECIEICGFGSFFLYYCELCVGCNFKIGDKVELEGKYVLYFKLGKELCECVNL